MMRAVPSPFSKLIDSQERLSDFMISNAEKRTGELADEDLVEQFLRGEEKAGALALGRLGFPVLHLPSRTKFRARRERRAAIPSSSKKDVTPAAASGHSRIERVDHGRPSRSYSARRSIVVDGKRSFSRWIAKPLCSSTNGGM
jgi:hypothetical protein